MLAYALTIVSLDRILHCTNTFSISCCCFFVGCFCCCRWVLLLLFFVVVFWFFFVFFYINGYCVMTDLELDQD